MALICSDVEQTIQFYQDVLGFPLIELMENRDYKGSSHLFFDIGHPARAASAPTGSTPPPRSWTLDVRS